MMTTRRHNKRKTYRVMFRSARTSSSIFGWPVRPSVDLQEFLLPSSSVTPVDPVTVDKIYIYLVQLHI